MIHRLWGVPELTNYEDFDCMLDCTRNCKTPLVDRVLHPVTSRPSDGGEISREYV